MEMGKIVTYLFALSIFPRCEKSRLTFNTSVSLVSVIANNRSLCKLIEHIEALFKQCTCLMSHCLHKLSIKLLYWI